VQLSRRFQDRGLQVLMVTREERERVMRTGLGESPIPILHSAEDLFQELRIEAVPRTLVINPQGETVHTLDGYSPDAMEEVVERLEKMPAAG
jgi:thioredoxin-related protein